MRGMVVIPLFIIIMVAVLSQLYYAQDFVQIFTGETYTVDNPMNNVGGSWFTTSVLGFVVGFNTLTGAITLLVGAGLLIVLCGLSLSGGFKPFGVGVEGEWSLSGGHLGPMLVVGVCMTGLFMFFSLLATPLMFAIPFFGFPLWFVLTLVFVLGVFEMMRGVA